MSRFATETEEQLRARAERAEQTIRGLYREMDLRELEQRKAITEANERQRQAERKRLLAEEMEASRRASWFRWHTLPGANITRFGLANFAPGYVAENTPDDPNAWPPDDAPGNYTFVNARAEARFEAKEEVPSLVVEARKRGLPV